MEEERLTIKNLPQAERPREKLEKVGAQNLTEAELLAILLRTGTKKTSALGIARDIIREKGLPYLEQASVFELQGIAGLGLAKATQIKAALELGRRLHRYQPQNFQIKSPADAANYLSGEMQYLDKEEFRILLLNTKNVVLHMETVSIGTANSSLAVPREIFKKAIAQKTVTAIILAHNHPSGDPTPSGEDIAITKRIVEAGKIIGIDVLDHIIIGQQQRYVSLKEKSLF